MSLKNQRRQLQSQQNRQHLLRLRQPLARLNLKPGRVPGVPVDSGRRVCVEGGVRFASVANVIDQRGVSQRAYPWQ